MRPSWHRSWRLLVAGMDAVFVTASLLAFTVARFGFGAIHAGFVPAPGRDFAQAPLLFAIPVWLAAFAALRLYNPQRCQNSLEEARRLLIAGLSSGFALVMLGFATKDNPARSWLVGTMALGTLSAAVGRQTVRGIASRFRERGRWMTPTVVVGRIQAKAVVEQALADRASGLAPVAVCGFDSPGLASYPLIALGDAVRETGAANVVVVAEDLERAEVNTAIEVADTMPVQMIVLPGLDHLLLGSLQLVTLFHEPGLAVQVPSLRTRQGLVKRALDLAIGSIALLFSLPLMALIAVAVRLDSRGPALFRQAREGRGGTSFELLKFRTMRDGCPEAIEELPPSGVFDVKDKRDPRLTRVGRFMRRSSLDELPQLWNVLRGEMSLVGPRPLPLWEAERLSLGRRMVVRPGLTGLWQVSGRSDMSSEERIRLDIVYVQNWSLLLDLTILLRTVPALVGQRGAY